MTFDRSVVSSTNKTDYNNVTEIYIYNPNPILFDGHNAKHIIYCFKLIYFSFISGIRENDLKKCMTDIPVTDGMIELLKYCQDQNYETIIISDSNSVFIDMILENAQLTKMVTKVFTNPAYFDENGCLKLDYYHTQDWCDLSTVNLCKGHILQGYIQKRRQEGNQFDFILYVGDGTNDLCPSLTLKEQDFVCPRINFRLWKKIQKISAASESEKAKLPRLTANILNWNSGLDVLECLKQLK